MADKHYINVQYKDLKNPGSAKFGYSKRSGRIKQLELSLRRGTGVQPEVHWDVTHAKTDDEIFLKDPIITQHGTNPDKTKLYYHMTLPNVGGVEWTVKCRFGDNPTQHAVANFVTWRRIMLSAQCPTVACARVFEAAMSKVTWPQISTSSPWSSGAPQ